VVCAVFFGGGEDLGFFCFYRGFLEKAGARTWFFGGVSVVECVVNVVF
jgi:hypothetical protein